MTERKRRAYHVLIRALPGAAILGMLAFGTFFIAPLAIATHNGSQGHITLDFSIDGNTPSSTDYNLANSGGGLKVHVIMPNPIGVAGPCTSYPFPLPITSATPAGLYTYAYCGSGGPDNTIMNSIGYTPSNQTLTDGGTLRVVYNFSHLTHPGSKSYTVGDTIQNIQITPNTAPAGSAPITFSATGLPSGVSISSSGLISGTVTTACSCSVTVTATQGSKTASVDFAMTVTNQPIPRCDNDADDDSDGLIDYPSDPGCTSLADNDEFNAPPPTTVTLTVTPDTIDEGETSLVKWASTGATSCRGSVDGGAEFTINLSGERIVMLSHTTSYRISCTGAGGSASATKTITVIGTQYPPATATADVTIANRAPTAVAGVSIENASPRTYAESISVPQGVPITLRFAPYTGRFPAATAMSGDADQSTNPDYGILNGGICAWNSDLSIDQVNPQRFDTQIDTQTTIGDAFPFDTTSAANDCVTSHAHTFNNAPGIYTYPVFRLTDKQGAQSNVPQVAIQVVAAPQITSFTATPNPINQDQSFTLSWKSSDTTNCSFNQGIGAVQPSDSKQITGLVVSPTTYILTCDSTDKNLFPDPVTADVTVTINKCSPTLTPSATSVPKPGDPITLSWSATNARSCTLNHTVTATTMCSTMAVCQQGGTTDSVAISSARTFTLSCTGDGGACSATTPTISVDNQAPIAKAGASLDPAASRTFSNTITVTQGVPTTVYLSAGPLIDGKPGSTDSDGSIASCAWNDDFNSDLPITFERTRTVGTGGIADCQTTVSRFTFTDAPTAPGTPRTYPILKVTDNEGAKAETDLQIHVLPRLSASLTATPTSGDAPFAPVLRAAITDYTGPASDPGNFSFWWDCVNTSNDLSVVSKSRTEGGCGPLPSDTTGGDRTCTMDANGGKCNGVPLQGVPYITVTVNPAYAARATGYTPKVIVERGSAVPAEDQASATAITPFAYTLKKAGGDIDVVKGTSGQTTITFDHTGGTAQRVDFACASGLPAGATCSFSPSNCTDDCTTTMTVQTSASTPADEPATITVAGTPDGSGNDDSTTVSLTVRDALTCGPATQTATVGVPISTLTAQGGTGSYAWTALDPADERLSDPKAKPDTGTGDTFTTTYSATGANKHVKVVSGSQNAQCTVNVTGQTLDAAISANPDTGTAPLTSTITGKITSGSTAVGTVNYSFWWDCTNTSAAVSDAINGTAGGDACNNPEGTTELATNYAQVTCKANGTGAKCFVDPADVPGFDPVNKPLQVKHEYAGRSAKYIPKVIIERGSAPAAEARYTPGIASLFPALSVSCSVPVSATAGMPIEWTATPSGGSGGYTYTWAGTDDLQGKTGTPASVTYLTAGTKTGTVTVRDSSGVTAASSQCSTAVSLPAGGAPVAIAGISRDTTSTKTYRSTVDVKKGESVELHFAAERTNTSGTLERSSDPDGWNDQFNGIGQCQFNTDLSTEAVIRDQFTAGSGNVSLANPPANAPELCRASRTHAFNDVPEGDAQTSRTITFNTLRLVDRQNAEAVGQASVVVHYQPVIAAFTVNGQQSVSVDAGTPVTVAWNASHASTCTGTNFSTGGNTSGSIVVNPTSDTTYAISCTGSPLWGAATGNAQVRMNPPPLAYTMAVSGDVSVVQRQSGTVSIRVTHVSGTPGSVAFVPELVTQTGQPALPPGVTALFANTPCTPPAGGICSPSPQLTLRTNQNGTVTPAGIYDITVKDSTLGKTASFTLTVTSEMSVGLAALPAPTGPATHVIQLEATAPAADYTGNPEDRVTYTFWKNCSDPGTDAGAVRTVCGTPDFEVRDTPDLAARTTDLIYTSQGTFQAKVVARRGAAAAEKRLAITVTAPFDYTLSLDRSRVEVVQGGTLSSANRAVVTNVSGQPSDVPFSARVQNLPPSLTSPVTFSRPSCAPPSGGSCAVDISIAVSRDMPAGDYPVKITAGTRTATFTLGVTSSIAVKLSALPAAAGPAPLSVQLKAETSGYTGSANDSLNYSFWWDCNNPGDNFTEVKQACGDPLNAGVGFKMDGTAQETLTTPAAHTYDLEKIYFAKVIVERAGARKEVRIPITVGSPRVSVTCTVSKASAVINEPVTWTAVASQGRSPFGFAWTRDVSCGVNPQQCGSVEMRYASQGTKLGTVTVTDADGDTAVKLCDNSVQVRQPTLVILPATAQVRVDGDTLQFAAKFDPDGPDGAAAEQDVTTQALWSIPLADQQEATISSAGRLTSGTRTGTLTVTAAYRDAFNNALAATADVAVISREALVCDPANQNIRVGENIFPLRATGGTGAYEWTVQETDADPRTGNTSGTQTFTTKFSATGQKTVNVRSGSQQGSCRVAVSDQTLSVHLSAFPASVTIPATTRLTAVVSGTALGTMNYSFWWHCPADRDADNTTRVEIAEGRCGEIPHGVPAGECRENQFGMACAGLTALSKAVDHAYAETGPQKPKVIVERGSAAPAQAKADVAVDAANRAPVAIAGVSLDQNANRAYAPSIVVPQNSDIRLYFAAFTGRESAPDQTSSDPDGWASALNGVHHPANPGGTGQCAWNADLDRDAQVSFEDVSGTNANPASPAECVTSRVHRFAEIGTHTYALLRITDNRGVRSPAALITVDVVPPGAPIALPGISKDPSANRIYRETVSVKQGEATQLWVSARRRVGATDQVSSDPDGWRSKNGGVSRGGSCRWNRDLDRGVFPTGIPTYEWIINDPDDPAEDCDTQLTNEAGNAFSRVFNDPPGIYSYEALRIFDNTGLRSNKGLVQIEVLPSDPPVAVATASTNNGVTFDDEITVVRGAPTSIIFSAAGSTDPDGWNNPINGVATAGHCDWNADLNQNNPTFENRVNTPASPAACNLPSRTFTFNDRPGVIAFDVLQITDNKGFTSTSPGGISVRVTAPDIVVSAGPSAATPAGLVENGTTAFTGTIRNQGDAGTNAAMNTRFTVDVGNDGGTDMTLASPAVAGLAAGAEKSVTSAAWSTIPAGTHKITLCADQPAPAVANEFFTDNNCASQVVTVLPDNRPPAAEAGISVDGTTYGASITVQRGVPVQIWLSADKDVTGDAVASLDPDGWLNAQKGVSAGGKCDWNIDLKSSFEVQNTVNNPSSPGICNRNRMDKTFNDAPGTYAYPVLRITDARGAASAVASISVRVVASASQLTHMECVNEACAVVSGAGANVCSVPGGACTGGIGPPATVEQPDLRVSRTPRIAAGELDEGNTVTFTGRVQNRSGNAITASFRNVFLVDLNNNGTVDVSLNALPRMAERAVRTQFAALPLSDVVLPLPPDVSSLGADEEATVTSGEWRNIPRGTHRVILCADSGSAITESDEDNNCDSSTVRVDPPGAPGGPLRVDSCGVSPSSVRAGQLVDWSANASGGTGTYGYSWSGDAPLEGVSSNPATVAYQTTGTKSGSVVVTSGSETASRSCGSVSVQPGITEFTANPRQINTGETSTLSWRTVGFSSCAITADQPSQSVGSVPTTGTHTVQPSRNTVYTLTCDAVGDSQSVTVSVTSVPSFREVTPQ